MPPSPATPCYWHVCKFCTLDCLSASLATIMFLTMGEGGWWRSQLSSPHVSRVFKTTHTGVLHCSVKYTKASSYSKIQSSQASLHVRAAVCLSHPAWSLASAGQPLSPRPIPLVLFSTAAITYQQTLALGDRRPVLVHIWDSC